MSKTSPPDEKDEYEILKVMHETALREYNDELSRTRDLDSKTTPMVAATGAILVFVAGVAVTPPAGLSDLGKGIYFFGIILALLALASAEFLFLSVLWGRSFERLALGDVLSPGWESSARLRKQLADTYRKVIAKNTQVNEEKARKYKYGIILMSIGLALLVIIMAVSSAVASAVTKGGS